MNALPKRIGLAVLPLALLAAMPVRAAQVQQEQQEAFARWRVQDKCILDSVTAHPDRNIESLRKRDKYVDNCMISHNLPPRAHLVPDDPKAPDATKPADAKPDDAAKPASQADTPR